MQNYGHFDAVYNRFSPAIFALTVEVPEVRIMPESKDFEVVLGRHQSLKNRITTGFFGILLPGIVLTAVPGISGFYWSFKTIEQQVSTCAFLSKPSLYYGWNRSSAVIVFCIIPE